MTVQQELRPSLRPVSSERKGEWPTYGFCGITLWFDPNLGRVGLLEVADSDPSQTEGFTELTVRLHDSPEYTPKRYLVFFDSGNTPRFIFVAGSRDRGCIRNSIFDPAASYNSRDVEVQLSPVPYMKVRRFEPNRHDPNLYVMRNSVREFQDSGTPNREHVGLNLDLTIPRKEGTGPWTIPGRVQIHSMGRKKIGMKVIERQCPS